MDTPPQTMRQWCRAALKIVTTSNIRSQSIVRSKANKEKDTQRTCLEKATITTGNMLEALSPWRGQIFSVNSYIAKLFIKDDVGKDLQLLSFQSLLVDVVLKCVCLLYRVHRVRIFLNISQAGPWQEIRQCENTFSFSVQRTEGCWWRHGRRQVKGKHDKSLLLLLLPL